MTVTSGHGHIRMPLKVGIVGGTLTLRTRQPPWVYGSPASVRPSNLPQLMAAVGLAQNFAALRARWQRPVSSTATCDCTHAAWLPRQVLPASEFDDVVER